MVSSLSSLGEESSALICSASSSASWPRRIVPEIGQVSTRRPSTRTNISGEAPTRYSPSPRWIRNPYGEGLRTRRRRKISAGEAAAGSANVCDSTTSNRSPRRNASRAVRTAAA